MQQQAATGRGRLAPPEGGNSMVGLGKEARLVSLYLQRRDGAMDSVDYTPTQKEQEAVQTPEAHVESG